MVFDSVPDSTVRCFFFLLDNQMFQYFITVVPTKLHTYKISAETHQFSVTERVSRRKKKNLEIKNLKVIVLNKSSNVKIVP